MTPTGRSRSNWPAPRRRRMWAGSCRTSPSVTSRRARRRPRGGSSGCGIRCRTAWSANCACAAFAPSRPRRPTWPSSSPTSISASGNRPPTARRCGAGRRAISPSASAAATAAWSPATTPCASGLAWCSSVARRRRPAPRSSSNHAARRAATAARVASVALGRCRSACHGWPPTRTLAVDRSPPIPGGARRRPRFGCMKHEPGGRFHVAATEDLITEQRHAGRDGRRRVIYGPMFESMRIGFHLTPFWSPTDRHPTQIIDEAIQVVAVASRMGYAWVSIGQHLLSHPTVWPQPFPMLARMAPETGAMRLKTSVLLLPIVNAVEATENIATLDHISHGRLDVGVSIGYRDKELETVGLRRPDRVPKPDESLALMKQLWAGDEVTFTGRYTRVTAGRMGFRPYQQPHPPLEMGAQSVGATRRAARLTDGVFFGPQIE